MRKTFQKVICADGVRGRSFPTIWQSSPKRLKIECAKSEFKLRANQTFVIG